jgi:hypothetical protein
MKKWMLITLIVPVLFTGLKVTGQDFPEISETERINRLVPPEGKVRMVLDTDTYNEISDGFVFKGSKEYLEDLEKPVESPAALDLIERAKTASPDDPLYVVAVGAITNVASAILMEPSIIHNIVVVWLGGNSINWKNTREFNFSQDLNASRLIFDCGVPFMQLPCTSRAGEPLEIIFWKFSRDMKRTIMPGQRCCGT